MKLPLVRADWGDAWAQFGWVGEEALCEAHPVRTTGYLLKSNKKGVLIAESVAVDSLGKGTFGNVAFIPKGMIYKIKKIKGEYVEVTS